MHDCHTPTHVINACCFHPYVQGISPMAWMAHMITTFLSRYPTDKIRMDRNRPYLGCRQQWQPKIKRAIRKTHVIFNLEIILHMVWVVMISIHLPCKWFHWTEWSSHYSYSMVDWKKSNNIIQKDTAITCKRGQLVFSRHILSGDNHPFHGNQPLP